MGWRELQARIRYLNEQRTGRRGPGPGSWDDPISKANFEELDAMRERMRGR